MYTLIGFMGLGLVASILWIANFWNRYCISEEERDFWGKVRLCIFAPIVFFIIGVFIGAAISAFVGLFPEQKRVSDGYTELVALKDGSSVSGSFFLGSGSVDNKQYYFYYYQTGSGGFKRSKIEATNDVTIFERSNESPKIRYYKKEFVDKRWENWAIPNVCEDISIIIPPNSITRKFDLGLN